MKLFIDSADYHAVQPYSNLGILAGVTLNPTILSQINNPTEVVHHYVKMFPEGDVCVQVTENDPTLMITQANDLVSRFGQAIVIKIPAMPNYMHVIQQLVTNGIRVNATVVATVNQAIMLAKLNVSYISVFIGRLNDQGRNGAETAHQIQEMLDTYGFNSELLVSSVRTSDQVSQAISYKADAITIPLNILEQLMTDPITAQGAEKFLQDWQKGNKNW